MRRKVRILVAGVAVPIVVGLTGLTRLMSRPQFAAYRTVDVLQLIGAGMCFGAALVGIITILRPHDTR